MTNKHRCGIALLALLFITPASAQPRNPLSADTLAWVGGEVITARDLLLRIELMPWIGKDRRGDREAAVQRAFHSLLGEKLLAREAFRLGIGEDRETVLLKRVLEKHLVRDELYRREVVAKVKAEEHEIREGLSRSARQRTLLLFFFEEREEGDRFYRQWLATRNLEHRTAPGDTLLLSFGHPDVVLEDVAYSIPMGGLSAPFESESGWVSLQVLDEFPHAEFLRKTPAERRNAVEKIVRRRNEDVVAGRYYAQILRPQIAAADPEVFAAFSAALLRTLREDSLAHRSGDLYMIVPDDVDALLGQFADSLDVPFVDMENGPMSLGEVIESFRYQRFGFRSLREETFLNGLNRCVRQIVQGELMAREGIRQNLQYVSQVKSDLAAWSEYWGARLLVRVLTDTVTVSEQEVVAFLVGRAGLITKEYQVNVREVLSTTLQEATEHLLAVQRGADLSEVALRSSIRDEWKARGGESGYFDVADQPHLGIPALLTDIGSLAGPLEIPRGYSVFTVLGKRRRDETSLSGEEIRKLEEQARREYRQKKVEQVLNQELIRLANEQGVEVSEEAVNRVEVGSIQMFTRRYLGFGGVMTAFPMLFSLPDWYDVWNRQKSPIP